MPCLRKLRYIILAIEWEKKVPNLFPNGLQRERSQMMRKRQLLKRNLEPIGNSLKTILNQGQIVLLQLWNLKRLFQGSMTLEQFVTKATLLVDEARYLSRQKDRMVCDTLIAGISNDFVCRKIVKKGPNVTPAQVLEISILDTATPQSLSEMSNIKPSVSYVRYDKKQKNKGEKPSQQQFLGKFRGSRSLPSTANWMLMENSKPKEKPVIDVGKADINHIRNAVLSMLSVTSVQERTFCCDLSKGQGIFTFF